MFHVLYYMILVTALTGLPGRFYLVHRSFSEGGLPSKLRRTFLSSARRLIAPSNAFLVVM
jgi:hypothetical protein